MKQAPEIRREFYDIRLDKFNFMNNKGYSKKNLNREDVYSDPVAQFESWMNEALAVESNDPGAMILSTVNDESRPSSRVVLLKKIRHGNFVFFTNYKSHKGMDLQQNSSCSLLFLWHDLERQVRIDGEAEKLPAEESDDYFKSRPRESRLGSWASPQSQEIEGRSVLEKYAEEMHKKFENKEIHRPPFWGGFQVKPHRMEFWQKRPARLHDRIQYYMQDSQWKNC